MQPRMFDGHLSNVQFYNKALSPKEIERRYKMFETSLTESQPNSRRKFYLIFGLIVLVVLSLYYVIFGNPLNMFSVSAQAQKSGGTVTMVAEDSVSTSNQKIFNLVVDVGEYVVIVGDSRNMKCAFTNVEPNCMHTIIDIPLKTWPETFSGWPDKPFKGQLLKGMFDASREFHSIASCEVRTVNTLEAKRKEAGYDGARFSQNPDKLSYVPIPLDCSEKYSEFIEQLLRSTNNK